MAIGKAGPEFMRPGTQTLLEGVQVSWPKGETMKELAPPLICCEVMQGCKGYDLLTPIVAWRDDAGFTRTGELALPLHWL